MLFLQLEKGNMKILITGGAGFIGSHLAEALLKAKHEVHIIDNLYSGFRDNVPADAVFYEYDISSPETQALIAEERYSVIFHQAAQLDVRKSVSDPTFDAHVNIIGTINLLESAVKAGTEKFIFASSGGTVYGEQDFFPAEENHPLRPVAPYGISKASVEMYLHFYQMAYGLNYVTLRYGNVYGPRQSPHGEAGVIAIFADKMLNNTQPTINGTGLQTRDYIYVKDVVYANLAALQCEKSGIYNIGTGIETNVVQIFDLINQQLGQTFERQFGEAKKGEQFRSVISPKKAWLELGWIPQYPLEKGMKETIDWFKNKHSQAT